MTNLFAHLVDAIDRARTAHQSDFTLTTNDGTTVFPHHPTPQTPVVPVFSLPAVGRATRLGLVARPQDCNCGASQVALVAHWEHCASRVRSGG